MHALPLGIVVLSLVMLVGLLGFAGREATQSASAGAVRLGWHAPTVIRNGEFLEMRITLASAEPIERPVLGIDASLWEDFTVNTFIPAAVDESSEDGEFRFEFGPMDAGASLLVKIDAQINLRRDRLTLSEIESEMRLAGIPHVRDVAWAIVEPRGRISFIPRDKDTDVNPQTDEQAAV